MKARVRIKARSNVEVRTLVLAAKAQVRAALEKLEEASGRIDAAHGDELMLCVKALRMIANASYADKRCRGLARGALAALKLSDLEDGSPRTLRGSLFVDDYVFVFDEDGDEP